ncbi:MAG: hypothetical protein K9M45_12520, partial [Kiritimatiellales bacterium]|nr:hypothetical protein [Kiritimatiellales bacterium]
MKKCMLVSLVLLLSASASFAAPNEWDGQLYITGVFGPARDLTYATNVYTVSDGFGFFRMLNHEDTTIQVNNAIKGFIEIDFNNDAYASGINITVIGRDDITNGTNRYDNLTLVQGGTADSETGNFSNARDAFLIDGSQNQSTLTMIEGEYLGGKDTGGGANVFSFEGIQVADLDNLYIYGA